MTTQSTTHGAWGDTHEVATRQSATSLIGLLLALAAGGAFLFATAGPPRLPAHWPSWQQVMTTLQGYDLPIEALAYVASTAAWTFWLWLTATLLLRLVVVLAEKVAHGAAWVRSLRLFSDWITLPFVRRAVDTALAAAVVVQVVGRPVPVAAAAPLEDHAIAAVVAVPRPAAAGAYGPPLVVSHLLRQQEPEEDARTARYTVQPGDTLWGIAQRFYATGEQYPRLIAANLDRRMADGRTFDRRAVIHPGWELRVPLPSVAVMQDEHGERWYVVEDGDTLSGIAARLLGEEDRWPELFALNRGEARLADGRTLEEPGLIWAGLRLRLPGEAAAPAPEPPAEATPAAVPAATVEPLAPPAPVESPQAVAPTPTPPSVEPPPSEVPHLVAPVAAEDPAGMDTPAPAPAPDEPISPLVPAAAGLGLAAAGGALLLARRRVRRHLDDPPAPRPPESDVVVHHDGYAEAADGALARAFAHRVQGAEADPAILAAERLLRAMGPEAQAAVVAVAHGRSSTTLTLTADLAEQARLVEAAPTLAGRLGAAHAEAWLTRDHDVQVQLTGLRRLHLVADETEGGAGRPRLLPVGVLPNRRLLYLNWDALGHVLLASLAGQGAGVVLTSLLAALTARYRPEELALWTIAAPRDLPPALAALPHQRAGGRAGMLNPADAEAVDAVLAEARTELVRRMETLEPDRWWGAAPEWLLVLGELADVAGEGEHAGGGERATTLELLGTHGPAYGLRLLAAGSRGTDSAPEDLLAHFATRLVFQMDTEEASIRLLGQPLACDLGEGGEFALRIAGREPLRVRGFRVPDQHLARLLALMHAAYGGPVTTDDAPRPALEENALAEPMEGADASAEAPGSDAAPEVAGAFPALLAADEDPARQFVTLLVAALRDRRAHLADPSGRPPATTPAAWGWRPAEGEDPGAAADARPGWSPTGERIGWLDGDDLYLEPERALAVAQATGAAYGVPFTTSPAVLYRRLRASELLASLDAARETVKVRRSLEGERRTVLHLRPDTLRGADQPEAQMPHALADGPAGAEEEFDSELAGGAHRLVLSPEDLPAPAPTPNGHLREAPADVAGPSHAPATGLEVRCFGGLSVRWGDRELEPFAEEDGRRKAQYNAWEVLAYLASHPDGAVTKERLMEAIWPGAREKQAENRLSVTLFRLREVLLQQAPGLPREVVRHDRDGRCRLNADMVASDVHRFLALVAAARTLPPAQAREALEQARALYRGDLLSGPGAPYYAWLFEHEGDGAALQDHYRQQHLRATRALAQLYADAGQVGDAVALYREILRAEPTAEDVVRDLYRCYERLGDLAALVREDQRLRRAIRASWAELEGPDAWDDEDGADAPAAAEEEDDPSLYEPEQETITLFHHIRRSLEARTVDTAGAGERRAAS